MSSWPWNLDYLDLSTARARIVVERQDRVFLCKSLLSEWNLHVLSCAGLLLFKPQASDRRRHKTAAETMVLALQVWSGLQPLAAETEKDTDCTYGVDL